MEVNILQPKSSTLCLKNRRRYLIWNDDNDDSDDENTNITWYSWVDARICAPTHYADDPSWSRHAKAWSRVQRSISLATQRAEVTTYPHHIISDSKHFLNTRGEMRQKMASNQRKPGMSLVYADGNIRFIRQRWGADSGRVEHSRRHGAGVETREQSEFNGFWRIRLWLLWDGKAGERLVPENLGLSKGEREWLR